MSNKLTNRTKVNSEQSSSPTNKSLIKEEDMCSNQSMNKKIKFEDTSPERALERKMVSRIAALMADKKAQGISQKQICDNAGLNDARFSNLMKVPVKKNWNLKTIQKIAEALGVPAADFFQDDAPVRAPETAELNWDLFMKYFDMVADEDTISPRTMVKVARLAYESELTKYTEDPENYEAKEDLLMGLILGSKNAA